MSEEKETKKCPFCGEDIYVNSNKCEFCGELLSKTCPFCGGEVKIIAKKCKHCGKFFDEEKNSEYNSNNAYVGNNVLLILIDALYF